MSDLTFIDKPTLFIITRGNNDGTDPGELSIQKAIFKSDGNYDVICVAAKSPTAEKKLRTGKYTIKEKSDHKITLEANEETGQFTGKYLLTFQWLDPAIGKVHCKKLDTGTSIDGIFQITT